MSQWSHILGIIEICMREHENDNQRKLDDRVKKLVNNLPLITGSERDMYIHWNRNEGNNVHTFGGYDDDVEYQTNYTLTLKGNLRDKDMIEDTCNELVRFINALSTNKDVCWIEDAVITINDGWHKSITYTLNRDESDIVNDDYRWHVWQVG